MTDNEQKQYLFLGYYAADGAIDTNRISTSDERIAEMIREISSVAGYYVASETRNVRNTNYKRDAKLITFRFRKHQNENNRWTVESIKQYRNRLQTTWCVEEPVTHSFTLDGGIVTGNCCLINLEDMFQNGTAISGTMIETPKSFSTACNIATQIIAQVASSQYGGQTITLSHLAPFVDVSRQKYRKIVREELILIL